MQPPMRRIASLLAVLFLLALPAAARAEFNYVEYWYFDNWMVNTGFTNLGCGQTTLIDPGETEYVGSDIWSTQIYRRYYVGSFLNWQIYPMWGDSGGATTKHFTDYWGNTVGSRHLTVYNGFFPNGVRVTKFVRANDADNDTGMPVVIEGTC